MSNHVGAIWSWSWCCDLLPASLKPTILVDIFLHLSKFFWVPATVFDRNIQGKIKSQLLMSVASHRGRKHEHVECLWDLYRPDQQRLCAGRGAHSTREVGGWTSLKEPGEEPSETHKGKKPGGSRSQLDLRVRRALRMSKHPDIPGHQGKGQL